MLDEVKEREQPEDEKSFKALPPSTFRFEERHFGLMEELKASKTTGVQLYEPVAAYSAKRDFKKKKKKPKKKEDSSPSNH